MSKIHYTQYATDLIDSIDLEELLNQLQDFFLQSGFPSQHGSIGSHAQNLPNLYQALADILIENEEIPQDRHESLEKYSRQFPHNELEGTTKELLDQLVERLTDHDYLLPSEESWGEPSLEGEGNESEAKKDVWFELTEKSIDLLGYKMFRELLGSVGGNSFGLHDTQKLSTGIQSDAYSRPYEFGDTLNLDVGSTLLRALEREGLGGPLNLEYEDLMVYQTDYQSSCATVLMLDCSHSMILYGEDRFTPAKKVALALAYLTRTQFANDSMHVVLFHDFAEEIPLAKLPSVKVGPYHTNTCEGLRLSREILTRQKQDMRQILMITDGKPSAIKLPNGKIYKNPFGLDPMILQETFKEVTNCYKNGISINTFMVARDNYLMDFVIKVSQICRGKAYFTNTLDLGNYLFMDFMNNKTKTVY